MKLKKFALKGLIALAVMVALCMFFANTVVTITTPKIRMVEAERGRLEQKMNLNTTVYFPDTTDYILTQAADNNIVVDKVYARTGQYVHAGDTLFTAIMPGYDKALADLQTKYNEQAVALYDKDMENVRREQETPATRLYAQLLEAQQDNMEKQYAVRVAAFAAGIALKQDNTKWASQAAGNSALLGMVREAIDAQTLYDEAHENFFFSFRHTGTEFQTTTFKYVKERSDIIQKMDGYMQDMLELGEQKCLLTKATAAQDGYVVSMDVKSGDTYDGKKSAYTLSNSGCEPMLRGDITSLGKTVADDTKVEVAGTYGNEQTTVESSGLELDGKKYAYITLNDSTITAMGGISAMLADGDVPVTLRYKAKQPAVLIPASAVRSEGSDSNYVYLVQLDYGGFLSGSSYKIVKTPVTVIERGDTQIAIQEDLRYQQIADGEDRALTDGCKVMEYVD